jgi:hypothetical protein
LSTVNAVCGTIPAAVSPLAAAAVVAVVGVHSYAHAAPRVASSVPLLTAPAYVGIRQHTSAYVLVQLSKLN